MAQVDNLQLDIAYQFQLKAKTSVGEGPPSATLVIQTQNPYPTPGQPVGPEKVSIQEQHKGIIIGVTVAGICIIVCIVLIILRNRQVIRFLNYHPPPPQKKKNEKKKNEGTRAVKHIA